MTQYEDIRRFLCRARLAGRGRAFSAALAAIAHTAYRQSLRYVQTCLYSVSELLRTMLEQLLGHVIALTAISPLGVSRAERQTSEWGR